MNFIEGLFHLILFNFGGFVDSLNKTPVIITWFVFLFFCLIVILFFLKFFGEAGMYVYTVLAIIGGNIQVLKIVEFPFFPNPIALGTILFATTFLATDILRPQQKGNEQPYRKLGQRVFRTEIVRYLQSAIFPDTRKI